MAVEMKIREIQELQMRINDLIRDVLELRGKSVESSDAGKMEKHTDVNRQLLAENELLKKQIQKCLIQITHKDKEIQTLRTQVEILTNENKVLNGLICVKSLENEKSVEVIQNENEKLAEVKQNDQDMKILGAKLNESRKKLKEQNESEADAIKQVECIEATSLKYQEDNEAVKNADIHDTDITKPDEKTDRTKTLGSEIELVDQKTKESQAKLKEDEECGKKNEVKNDKQITHLMITGLKEMILDAHVTKNWTSCIHLLELRLNRNGYAYQELLCVKRGYEHFPLLAAQFGCINLVSVLLANGLKVNKVIGDVNGCDQYGMLHCAVKFSHLDLVKELLSTDVNIEERVKSKGPTPLYLAAQYGHHDILKLLIEKGADCNVPLGLAVMANQTEIVDLLLSCGAIVDTIIDNNKTLLQNAVLSGYPNIVKILINKGANIHVLDEYGKTPLHVAAEYGFGNIIEILVNSGADMNKGDKNLDTPLHLAAYNNHLAAVQSLVQYGHCKKDMKNKSGKTPFDNYCYNSLFSRRKPADDPMEKLLLGMV